VQVDDACTARGRAGRRRERAALLHCSRVIYSSQQKLNTHARLILTAYIIIIIIIIIIISFAQ